MTVDQQTERVSVVDIDPERASEMLKTNILNRPMREPYAETLAGAMRRGEWVFNGEAVRTDDDGNLIDGQHRLRAIVLSGLTQRFVLIEGLGGEAQETIDTGARRKVADFLRLRGYDNVSALGPALRYVWMYDNLGSMREHGRRGPTAQQTLSVLEYQTNVPESTRLAGKVRRQVPMSGSILGACFALFRDADEGDALAFAERLKTGAGLHEGDPVLALRKYLLNRARTKVGRHPPFHAAALTVKAFDAYVAGREIGHLAWRPGGERAEPFPIVPGRPPRAHQPDA